MSAWSLRERGAGVLRRQIEHLRLAHRLADVFEPELDPAGAARIEAHAVECARGSRALARRGARSTIRSRCACASTCRSAT